MLAVVATPFGGLLELFVAVPIGLIAGILGTEYASSLWRRRWP